MPKCTAASDPECSLGSGSSPAAAIVPPSETILVDGVPVHIEGSGDETILMVHGWPDTHRLWDGTVAALADAYRCCRFTLPGHGPDGGEPVRPPDLSAIVQLLLHVADAVCPDRKLTLLLHDWGCVFGYQFYMLHPERVARIIGVDIGDTHRLPTTLPAIQLAGIFAYQFWLALAWKIGGRAGDRMTRWLAKQMRVPADSARIGARMNWPYAQTWFGGERSLRRQAVPFHPECPMLYIWGTRKPFVFHSPGWPSQVERLPGGRAQAFATSHWVMLDDPAGFNSLVRSWLQTAPTA